MLSYIGYGKSALTICAYLITGETSETSAMPVRVICNRREELTGLCLTFHQWLKKARKLRPKEKLRGYISQTRSRKSPAPISCLSQARFITGKKQLKIFSSNFRTCRSTY